jgi:hypothetical protein
MNLEFLFLYLLSSVAAWVTFRRIKEQAEPTLFDWIAFGSLVLLMAQTLTLALNVKMWI